MKQISILFAFGCFFSPAFGQPFTVVNGSGTTITIGSESETDASVSNEVQVYSVPHVETRWGYSYDFKQFTRFTDWHVGFPGDTVCVHNWLYWEEGKLVEADEYAKRFKCEVVEAGKCNTITNEARVCDNCYRGEVRARFDGWDIVIRKEEEHGSKK